MNNVSQLKKMLRQQRSQLRNDLAERTARSETIKDRVLAMPQVEAAELVCCFVSFRSEVETHALIGELLANGKQVCVPWCKGEVLKLCRIESLNELQPRTMGILEPPAALRNRVDRQRELSDSQVVIVPGLAFTESGTRLGYGKGHYDRMLAKSPDTIRIAISFENQIVSEMPTDQYDMSMYFIATEQRLIPCRD